MAAVEAVKRKVEAAWVCRPCRYVPARRSARRYCVHCGVRMTLVPIYNRPE